MSLQSLCVGELTPKEMVQGSGVLGGIRGSREWGERLELVSEEVEKTGSPSSL